MAELQTISAISMVSSRAFRMLSVRIQDESPAVLGNHANVDPPLTIYQFGTSDVVYILTANLAVVCALVVEPDPRLVVTHVDEGVICPVAHRDLRSAAPAARRQ